MPAQRSPGPRFGCGILAVVCGRYESSSTPAAVAEAFGVQVSTVPPDRPPSWNVAPSQPVLAVVRGRAGERRLGELRWGFVPSGSPDPAIGSRLINARAESVASSPAFCRAFATRRALIPADSYYEWQTRPGAVGARRPRQPYRIHPARAGAILGLGGIWEIWRGHEGERLATCSIITVPANATTSHIHDRMPLILPAVAWERWLDPRPLSAAEATSMLVPAPGDLLTSYAVSFAVNSPRNDTADVIRPEEGVQATRPTATPGGS